MSAFVEEAVAADVVILTLHGGKASCPAYDPLCASIRDRRAKGVPTPYLHIQPTGGDEEAVLAAQEDSDGMDDGTWRGLCLLFNHGGADNIYRALKYLAGRCRGEELRRD